MVSCSITHLHYDDAAPRESEQGKTRPVASLVFLFFSATGVQGGRLRKRTQSSFPCHGYTASGSLKRF